MEKSFNQGIQHFSSTFYFIGNDLVTHFTVREIR